MIPVKDIQKTRDKSDACKDSQERLRVGAAVWVGGDTLDRVAAPVESGVDVLVVDTAHGHGRGVLDRERWVKRNLPETQVIGGNITTAEGALALAGPALQAANLRSGVLKHL